MTQALLLDHLILPKEFFLPLFLAEENSMFYVFASTSSSSMSRSSNSRFSRGFFLAFIIPGNDG